MRRKQAKIIILLALTVSVAGELALARDASQEARPARAGARSINYLTRDIRNELVTLPYYGVFDWLQFQVSNDGTVTLRGQVLQPTTRSRAESRVKDIEGVERVVNEIDVLPVSPNDDRLRQRLYRAIYSGPLFRYAVGSLNTIHIIVRNGRVTLEGYVNSEADRQIAYTRARSVGGTFEVRNNLQVISENDR